MRTGEIEANIVRLNEDARLLQIPDLVARKLAGPEKATLDEADVTFHEGEVARLRRALEEAGAASSLAEEPTAREALHDLLLRVRLG
jgi:predicted nucleotidyltransferase